MIDKGLPLIGVKSIREQTKLSQLEFAEKYNIPVATIRDWEQGRRKCPVYVVELLNFKVEYDLNEKATD